MPASRDPGANIAVLHIVAAVTTVRDDNAIVWLVKTVRNGKSYIKFSHNCEQC